MPSLSIITASYNYESYIGETVRSVLSQDHSDWELIIVDDGSSDNSMQVIAALAATDNRIRLLTHPNGQNRGLARTLELGLRHARGDLIAFLESDDLWRPDCLSRRYDAFVRHPDADVLFNAVVPFGDEAECRRYLRDAQVRERRLGRKAWPRYIGRMMLFENVIPTFSAVTIRRETLKFIDLDPPFDCFVDWWLYCQLALRHRFFYVDEALTLWRKHRRSYTRNTDTKRHPSLQAFTRARLDMFQATPSWLVKRVALPVLRRPRLKKLIGGAIHRITTAWASF
ncbi:glycosyl transferase family 2 family protein [Asticcacaulis biprosthecium C19]|uniref:Glycosyl transferase family 2 family protein n=1 Tax=Asticcacaulis biprosthecium C19 TaxID=715226 RepID=F4QKR5_9CAUL|nr:glycosyltransferase [Asticcacaulis biprosthecium]EGF93367.1 glycosyl transferase family 2 family protein [Asticcacaulis biprosthecium C19]